jgi:hypothetical protein
MLIVEEEYLLKWFCPLRDMCKATEKACLRLSARRIHPWTLFDSNPEFEKAIKKKSDLRQTSTKCRLNARLFAFLAAESGGAS